MVIPTFGTAKQRNTIYLAVGKRIRKPYPLGFRCICVHIDSDSTVARQKPDVGIKPISQFCVHTIEAVQDDWVVQRQEYVLTQTVKEQV